MLKDNQFLKIRKGVSSAGAVEFMLVTKTRAGNMICFKIVTSREMAMAEESGQMADLWEWLIMELIRVGNLKFNEPKEHLCPFF